MSLQPHPTVTPIQIKPATQKQLLQLHSDWKGCQRKQVWQTAARQWDQPAFR